MYHCPKLLIMHSEDMMDVPTQGLAAMSIYILKQNHSKVKSCNKKRKVMKGEELLPQLIVHTVEGTFAKTFEQKLASGERFQN